VSPKSNIIKPDFPLIAKRFCHFFLVKKFIIDRQHLWDGVRRQNALVGCFDAAEFETVVVKEKMALPL